jgi:hypothetical protein
MARSAAFPGASAQGRKGAQRPLQLNRAFFGGVCLPKMLPLRHLDAGSIQRPSSCAVCRQCPLEAHCRLFGLGGEGFARADDYGESTRDARDTRFEMTATCDRASESRPVRTAASTKSNSTANAKGRTGRVHRPG